MNDDTRKRLLKRRYRFFSDPSHAWLRVPMADIVALRLEDSITQFSYTRDSIVYLEEDNDATLFRIAYQNATGELPTITEAPPANNASRIRGYAAWNRRNVLLNVELRKQRDKQTDALPVFETRLAKIQEGSGRYETPITSTRIACDTLPALLRDYFADRCDCEEFAIVTLDTKHRPTGLVRVTRGTLDASLVHPREVFRAAIAASASAIILVHNHPSGDTTPSREDRAVTDRLTECGKMLGINVLDHIVIGGANATSIREAA
ncbi:hypothetical protein Enr13x_07400 [Stieleria neptunia]|uniref:MPN domain-containing protein n=1 Tax=Stieleria neptunia TaxID=2527979 RepID=A0A518HJ75_9BACT|nr:JAB domain-containing protein [Stieleria neptunia]QDV40904.1 hypothetical protein Enr13x_07400 [Stieleria neptunia]